MVHLILWVSLPLFTKMIWNTISSASFSVLIEGSPIPPFKNHRGIRQGDFFSPILFDMVMDIISRLIEREVREKRIDTQVNETTSITHLMYADNVLIFTKDNRKSLNAIKKILGEFSLHTSLEFNASKSTATYSKVCMDDTNLHNILGFPSKSLPIHFLGFPIKGKKVFQSVLEITPAYRKPPS